jgi:DNA-binding NarL/FixJ family response regulator
LSERRRDSPTRGARVEAYAARGRLAWLTKAAERDDRLHSAAIPNVAALAAAGHINREVAVQELFITVATVDRHLRRVYRKLGVDGRSALPAAMDDVSSGQARATRG